MKVLALTKYGPLAASTRQRFLQYRPWLTAAGLTLEVSPLLDDIYLRQKFGSGPIGKLPVLLSYIRRLRTLLAGRDYDLLWVHVELFPYLPGVFERLIALSGRPVVYDLDDAVFHNYDLHRSPLVRAILAGKIKPLVRRAAAAFCGNAYLQQWAKGLCRNAMIVPTVVDIDQYVPATRAASQLPCIGWIGSPSTFEYVVPHLPVLEGLVAAGRATVMVIGTGRLEGRTNGIDYVDWTEAGEIAAIQAMDIGIMPAPDTPWARGKCGYKLIQYMACGLPVVASPVGVNSDIVEPGVNGFLATTGAEWATAFDTLLGDVAIRARLGEAGRARVVRDFSVQRFGPEVARTLLAAARSKDELQ